MPKHENTLEAVKEGVRTLKWRDIESMLKHYGAEISEGRGSRVRVQLNGVVAVFHRPHPSPDARRMLIRSVKRFVEKAGL